MRASARNARHARVGGDTSTAWAALVGGRASQARPIMDYILLFGLVRGRIRVCFLLAYTIFAERLQMAAAVGRFH